MRPNRIPRLTVAVALVAAATVACTADKSRPGGGPDASPTASSPSIETATRVDVPGARTAPCSGGGRGPILLAIVVAPNAPDYSLERVAVCPGAPTVEPGVVDGISGVAAHRNTIVVTFTGRVRDQAFYLRGDKGVPLPRGPFDSQFTPVFTPRGDLVMPVFTAKSNRFALMSLARGTKRYRLLHRLTAGELMFPGAVDAAGRVVVPTATGPDAPASRLLVVDGRRVRFVDVARPRVRAVVWLGGDRFLVRSFDDDGAQPQAVVDVRTGQVTPVALEEVVIARIDDNAALTVSANGDLVVASGQSLEQRRRVGKPPGHRVVAGTWLPAA